MCNYLTFIDFFNLVKYLRLRISKKFKLGIQLKGKIAADRLAGNRLSPWSALVFAFDKHTHQILSTT